MTTELVDIPITHIDTNPNNPRHSMGPLDDLVASIRTQGVIEPVIVRPNGTGDTFQLVAGHRRLAAAIRADLNSVPAIVRSDLDDAGAVVIALEENMRRLDIDPVDEASGYSQLLGFGWKQKDIAATFGRSAAHVSKRLRLLDLPEAVLNEVHAGELSIDVAYEIASVCGRHGLDPSAVATEVLGQDPARRGNRLDLIVFRVQRDKAFDEYASKLTAEKGHTRIAQGRDQYGAITVTATNAARVGHGWSDRIDFDDPDDHVTEPCARFEVFSGNYGHDLDNLELDHRWWCVDPNRHSNKGDSPLKFSNADEARARDEKKAKEEKAADRARHKHRRNFIGKLFTDVSVAGRIDYDEVVPKAWDVFVDRLEVSVAKTACDYLRLTPVEEERVYGGPYKDYKPPLRIALDQDLHRTLLAITLAQGETMAGYSYVSDGTVDAHLEYLGRLGYTPDQELT